MTILYRMRMNGLWDLTRWSRSVLFIVSILILSVCSNDVADFHTLSETGNLQVHTKEKREIR